MGVMDEYRRMGGENEFGERQQPQPAEPDDDVTEDDGGDLLADVDDHARRWELAQGPEDPAED